MFTGIIEATGIIRRISHSGTNTDLWIEAPFIQEIKVDQSIAHNGVCLTVNAIADGLYKVTAIDQTLRVTALGELHTGSSVNLERCMPASGRFDGHIVQGHVDGIAMCKDVLPQDGSWLIRFDCDHPDFDRYVVAKGSITVNGISLTVAELSHNQFTVAIIPYTWDHTSMHSILPGSRVNIEFDIIGKYVAQQLKTRGMSR